MSAACKETFTGLRRFSGIRIATVRIAAAILICLALAACASPPTTRVSGSLALMSKDQSVAILPVLVTGKGQREAARLFRQSLHANLKQARFDLMERALVDRLVRERKITPRTFQAVSPMEWGEILGADAVVQSRMDRVERSYLFLHSSIEIEVSVQMIDTRSGEVLWMAHQTEKDFSGIGKIPTGLIAAALAPIKFVTNKFNLHKMTRHLADSITALVKRPENAQTEQTFRAPVVTSAAREELAQAATVSAVPAAFTPAEHATPHARTIQPPARRPQPVPRTYEDRVLTPRRKSGDNWVYSLQVGAYRTKSYAERLLKKLIAKGHHAFVRITGGDDRPLYRVQVEQFDSASDAQQFSRTFTREEQLDGFVTRLPAR